MLKIYDKLIVYQINGISNSRFLFFQTFKNPNKTKIFKSLKRWTNSLTDFQFQLSVKTANNDHSFVSSCLISQADN
jgi:hypothetical protein